MSNTPRTDAMIAGCPLDIPNSARELCRALELELAEMQCAARLLAEANDILKEKL